MGTNAGDNSSSERNLGGLLTLPRKGGLTRLLDAAMHPSHEIAGDTLIIAFEADPEACREFVAEPFEVDGSGRCYLITHNLWNYSELITQEFVSPERYHLQESYLKIRCTFKGQTYYYFPFSWANCDWVTVLSRPSGIPHRMAKVQMTGFHPAATVYNEPKPGLRVCVSVENIGLVLRCHLDIDRPCPPSDYPFPVKGGIWQWQGINHRYVWDSVARRPVINDLVAIKGDKGDFNLGPVWDGKASLTFYDAEAEDVLRFQPRRVVRGWFHTMNFRHRRDAPELLHDYLSDATRGS